MPAYGEMRMHTVKISQTLIDRVVARRDRLHAFTSINPASTAHVVVDLQNGFMAPGQPAEIPMAREIIPNVNRISRALRDNGGLVVYIQNTIDEEAKRTWSNWFGHMSGQKRLARMEEAFREGSVGHALWSELEVLPSDLKVKKSRYGAFVPGASDLHKILQERGIDTVIVTGTATNVCCESTARDAMMLNYKVLFVSDGTATWTDEEHNAALGALLIQFADIRSTDEVVELLSSGAKRQAAE